MENRNEGIKKKYDKRANIFAYLSYMEYGVS